MATAIIGFDLGSARRPYRPEGKKLMVSAIACGLIRLYQMLISPLLPPSCRFYPSCSAYAIQAIVRYGVWKGLYLMGWRLLRCHPFHPGGWDPVE